MYHCHNTIFQYSRKWHIFFCLSSGSSLSLLNSFIHALSGYHLSLRFLVWNYFCKGNFPWPTKLNVAMWLSSEHRQKRDPWHPGATRYKHPSLLSVAPDCLGRNVLNTSEAASTEVPKSLPGGEQSLSKPTAPGAYMGREETSIIFSSWDLRVYLH